MEYLIIYGIIISKNLILISTKIIPEILSKVGKIENEAVTSRVKVFGKVFDSVENFANFSHQKASKMMDPRQSIFQATKDMRQLSLAGHEMPDRRPSWMGEAVTSDLLSDQSGAT